MKGSTGQPIPAFDERRLAVVTDLPAGFRLTGDVPSGPPELGPTGTGDVRSYTSAAGSLTLAQIAGAGTSPPAGMAPGGIVTAATVKGRPATTWLLAPVPLPSPLVLGGVPLPENPSIGGVSWAEGGYAFAITSTGRPALSSDALLALADSVGLPAS